MDYGKEKEVAFIDIQTFTHIADTAGADPGGGPRGPGPPPTLGFEAPKLSIFGPYLIFSIIFFCLASLSILFL